jgi:hypothetical protein
MKSPKPKHESIWVIILLAALFALLFWKSFVPGFVEFFNDGPLGQVKAAWTQLPAGMFGAWEDLNDIGFNGGVFSPSLTTLIRWMLGPVGFAKFYTPMALVFLGLCAWTLFSKGLKLSPLAAILGALAAALASTFFSDACWGLAPHEIAFGMDYLALALIVSNSPTTPFFDRCLRLALAGFAVGINVIEAADIGTIFSLVVAAFALYHSWIQEGAVANKKWRGVWQILIVPFIAFFAAWMATQTIWALKVYAFHNSQAVAVTQQDAETKAAHWDFATQWSLPKIETFGIIVPGLFGYRMDTPGGGNYWGAIGRDPNWDRYFEDGNQGSPPDPNGLRFSGDGYYVGVLVALVALWTIAQSLRGQNSIFSETHRRFLWFWTVIMMVSLLLSFGRFGLFDGMPYRLFYALPYFSTIRNPNKFLFVFTWAIVIVFAYGIDGLDRCYLRIPIKGSTSLSVQLKNWWTKVHGFDRNWVSGCGIAIIGSFIGWLIYASEKPSLVCYLQTVGFPDEDTAKQIATFSIAQVGWFILFFVLAAGLLTLILAGIFSGRRAKWAGIFLGALLILDLGRANLPWIVHWDYMQKYDVDPGNPDNSTNPIINFLRDKSYEHRVAILPFPSQGHLPFYDDDFGAVYRIEWAQHHFPYYNIQSLDIIQNPRPQTDSEAYSAALVSASPLRRWELTNTRYLLGPAAFLDPLNQQLDPGQQRFRIVQRFDIMPKPGIEQATKLEELTAVPNDNGGCALFEFTGALPRAKLYSNWQTGGTDPATLEQWVKTLQQRVPKEMGEALTQTATNDLAVLYTLASANFDPAQTVLISAPLPVSAGAGTNQNSGTVEYTHYEPKDIVLNARADAPSVLLLNDKFDPNWRVSVDGQPAPLLRCNFIMRGVYLTAGAHTVEFQFKISNRPLYVTLTAMVVGMFLIGGLIFPMRRTKSP